MRWTSLLIPAAVALAVGCQDDDGILEAEEQQEVADLKVSPATARVYVGGEIQLVAEPFDSSGHRVRRATVYWTTPDVDIVTVSRQGRVFGLSEGTARVSARCHRVCTEVVITVELDPARPITAMRVVPDRLMVRAGTGFDLRATPLDNAGRPVPGAALSWSSSDPAVARVSANGHVIAMDEGTATITATSHGISGSAYVRVEGPPTQANPGPGTPFDAFGLHWTYAPPAAAGIFYDVWGSSPSDVFAVGTTRLWDCCPIFVHYDGTAWTTMPMPSLPTEFTGVWGSSGSDVFAVGGAYVYHYDGVAWQEMEVPPGYSLGAVWGSSSHDVFAVGTQHLGSEPHGAVLHYDGNRWSPVETPGASGQSWLTDVWGSSGSDVFVVGGTTVLHYDGTQWQRMNIPPTGPLQEVWGSSPTDVFATGVGGVILHYDGSTWTPMQSPTTLELAALWGTGPDDVYAAGTKNWWPNCCSVLLHYDGNNWSAVETTTGHYLLGIWGTADAMFIAGSMGVIQGGR